MRSYLHHTCQLVFLVVFPALLRSQPEIISVAPSAALPGETVNITVTGSGTNFLQGQTTIDLGPSIQVLELQVNHSLFLTAVVQIEGSAPVGFHDLTVTTGNEIVSLPQAFEILEPGSAVNVVLTIIPVQTLYLSDLNPNSPEENPLLFSISLYNDNQQRNLHVQYILSNDEFGTIGSADKFFNNLPPLSVEVFNNRQFDEYHLNPASPELLNIAASTGVMPAGAYTYTVLVFDENGTLIAQDEGVNIISNENSAIDLISPGASLDQNPEVTPIATPFFQWFSTLTDFHFALYEVNEGQQSANEITTNLPVYEQDGISTPFLQYPVAAEILEGGKTYAWQVTGHLASSQGEQTVFSPVFWFVVGDGNGTGFHLSSLEVSPEVANIQIGRNYQFEATGLDSNGEPVPVQCTWSVIPFTAGTVTPNGLFTAGTHSGAAAVVASCGGLEAYATATITWSVTDQFFDVEKLFDKVFGLKPKN